MYIYIYILLPPPPPPVLTNYRIMVELYYNQVHQINQIKLVKDAPELQRSDTKYD